MIFGDYNVLIVILSFAIAVASSFLALNIAGKIFHGTGRMRVFWLFSGAIVMGMWSMHFIGMLALHSPTSMRFDGWITFLSMIVSIFAAFLAFQITETSRRKPTALAVGAVKVVPCFRKMLCEMG